MKDEQASPICTLWSLCVPDWPGLGHAVVVTGVDTVVNHKDMEAWMPSEV